MDEYRKSTINRRLRCSNQTGMKNKQTNKQNLHKNRREIKEKPEWTATPNAAER